MDMYVSEVDAKGTKEPVYSKDAGRYATSLIVDTKGTKEPVYSKDAGRYAKACPESRGIATVS